MKFTVFFMAVLGTVLSLKRTSDVDQAIQVFAHSKCCTPVDVLSDIVYNHLNWTLITTPTFDKIGNFSESLASANATPGDNFDQP